MKTSIFVLRFFLAVSAAFALHPRARAQSGSPVIVNGTQTTIQLGTDGIVFANGPLTMDTPVLSAQAQEAGVRMLWYPRKAAFRAGAVSSAGSYGPWGDYNIGLYSFATGRDTRASGNYSFAAGLNSVASGEGSIAIGMGASTTAGSDIAIGTGASTYYGGLVIGASSYADSQGVAYGYSSSASGAGIALGKSATAGNYGVALGRNVVATNNSTAIGQFSQATGFHSAALGSLNLADGKYATALGYYTTARAFGSTVVGRFNTIQGNPAAPDSTNPIFVVGKGADANNPADAFIVYQSGNAALAGTLTVNGSPVLTANSGGGITLSGGDRVITMGTSPSYVGGALTLRAGDANSSITNINGGNLILSSGAGTGTGFSAISFKTSGASAGGVNQPVERMTIDSSGRVGIGVNPPAARMDIASIEGTDALRVRTQTDTSPSTPFRITADGRVLVSEQGDISMGDFRAGDQP